MRRLLFPVLMVGLAAGLFTLGSGAFLKDSGADTNNKIASGTLDLTLGGAVGLCDYASVIPGQTLAACTKTLNMAGTLNDLHLDVELHATNLACDPNGANNGIANKCDTSADLSPADFLVHACSFPAAGACPWLPFPFVADAATLADFIAQGCRVLDADSDASEDGRVLSLTLKVKDIIADNTQGDAIDITFHFGLSTLAPAPVGPASRCHP